MSELHGFVLLVGALLVAVASLGLALHGKSRAPGMTTIGVAGVVLTFATVASARRLEASAQAWILCTILLFAIEIALVRVLRRAPPTLDDAAPPPPNEGSKDAAGGA